MTLRQATRSPLAAGHQRRNISLASRPRASSSLLRTPTTTTASMTKQHSNTTHHPARRALLPLSPLQNPRRRATTTAPAATTTPNQTPVPTASPGKTTLAFVGIGIMGLAMCKNLLKAGYDVVVWNRTPERCAPLEAAGARVAATARAAAAAADITFGMLADPAAALAVAQGPEGVAAGLSPGKGYVDVSTVDVATSRAVAGAVRASGALFLEAPVSGSKGPAEQGQLIFLTAGDEQLYHACSPALDVMGKAKFYLGGGGKGGGGGGGGKEGEVGNGAIMKLVINQIMGGVLVAFAEGMNLASAAGLDEKQVLEVASLGAIANPMMALKGAAMVERRYPTAFPLKHSEKDLRLALALAKELGLGEEGTGVVKAAYAAHQRASAMGKGDDDFSAVMEAVLKK